jgi:hypothetical protein
LGFAQVLCPPAYAQCKSAAPERLELRVFKYDGVTAATEASFSLFVGILSEKLANLPYEAGGSGPGMDYLRKLTLKPTDASKIEPPPSSRIDDLRTIWEFQNSHLLLLRGILYPDPAVPNGYQVTSSIYWGDLRPPDLRETVQAKLPITPEGFADARDSHSMVTLFALAMDAKRRECHSSVVLHLLEKALEKAHDLERGGQLTGDLGKLKLYIEEQIRAPLG